MMEGMGGPRILQQQQSSSSSSCAPNQRNHLEVPIFNSSEIGLPARQFAYNLSPENMLNPQKFGIPSPHSHFPPSAPNSVMPNSQNVGSYAPNVLSGSSNSRFFSQPAWFSLDSLPPLSPSPYSEPTSSSLSDPVPTGVSKNELDSCGARAVPLSSFASRDSPMWINENGLVQKGHRRSSSDIPYVFSTNFSSSLHLMPANGKGNSDSLVAERASSVVNSTTQSAKHEPCCERDVERNSEKEMVDDLFMTYMNLDKINALNSSTLGDREFEGRGSGTKLNRLHQSDNEAESIINRNPEAVQGKAEEKIFKRSRDNLAPASRHSRSLSMDSFMGNLHFGDDSPKPQPSPQTQLVQKCEVNSLDDNASKFSLDFGSGEFSAPEMEKIMANEKLAEIASSDPKRAKRILANRQSAARSKERKMRYISELEHKVQTLQTEATTLSTQVTLLQKDTSTVTSQNSELKFRIQAMEQQAQLKDALNEALTVEIQRLRFAAAGLDGKSNHSSNMERAGLHKSTDVKTRSSVTPATAPGAKWQD